MLDAIQRVEIIAVGVPVLKGHDDDISTVCHLGVAQHSVAGVLWVLDGHHAISGAPLDLVRLFSLRICGHINF